MNVNTVRPLVMTSNDEHIFLTPAQAARRAGVSRPTINRALKSLALSGRRDNQNRWQIEQTDLDRWSEGRLDEQVMTTDHDQTLTTPDDQLEQVRAELGKTREKLAAEIARANAAEADRDRWMAMAEKMADRPRSWWPWDRKRKT